MKQGMITVTPKPGKYPKIIDNLWPITLLTNYDKISYFVCTYLCKKVQIWYYKNISDTQSGFIKGWSHDGNIRLVLDLLEYSHLIEGFILFLDFSL